MEYFFSHNDAYAVLGFLALTLPAAAAFIAYFWYKVRREEMQIHLKRTMLERGMSADEIRMVIESGATSAPDSAPDSSALASARPRT
jgi:hypothetical protein